MLSKPRPDTKRWWNSKLTNMRKQLNKLRIISFKFRAISNHPSHNMLRTDSNQYSDEITVTKRQHWEDYVEDMMAEGIWTANNFIKNPPGNGSQPQIPSLKTTNATGVTTVTNDNASKALLFAGSFFPPPPPPLPQDQNQQENEYPDPLPNPLPITTKQVKSQIANLPSYKAHGPDGIPNIILKECSDLLSMPLTTIFNAIIDLNLYYDPWKESITVVLRKPGKPNYKIPKAY